ncbi:hypothetical protein ACN08P_17340 [Photobacterium leiognathi subsp. mandapamensis]|uniref:hypothetical protein n=1 Tax=Photobacterium leiognathi TaxID=553611 RepID=UPI003AF3C050
MKQVDVENNESSSLTNSVSCLSPSISVDSSEVNVFQQASPYLGYVSLLFVIIGWSIVYNNAKKLATRNETKALIDDTVKVINQLEDLTVTYWLAGRKSRIDTDEFILLTSAKIQTLSYKLKIVEQRDIDISCINFSKLATLMTLNCEDVDWRKTEDNRAQVQLFLEEVNSQVASIYAEFQHKYKPSIPARIGRAISQKK